MNIIYNKDNVDNKHSPLSHDYYWKSQSTIFLKRSLFEEIKKNPIDQNMWDWLVSFEIKFEDKKIFSVGYLVTQ